MKKNYSKFYQITFVRDPDRTKINMFMSRYARHIYSSYYQLRAIYEDGEIRYLTEKDSLNGNKILVFTKIGENVLEFQYDENILGRIKNLLYSVSDPDDLIIVDTENPNYNLDSAFNMIESINNKTTRIRFSNYRDKSKILSYLIMDKRIATKEYMINSIIDLNGLDIVIKNRDYLINIIKKNCNKLSIKYELFTDIRKSLKF